MDINKHMIRQHNSLKKNTLTMRLHQKPLAGRFNIRASKRVQSEVVVLQNVPFSHGNIELMGGP